eukprot:Pgem_evm1s6557
MFRKCYDLLDVEHGSIEISIGFHSDEEMERAPSLTAPERLYTKATGISTSTAASRLGTRLTHR